MITAYTLTNHKVVSHTLSAGAALPTGTVWLDLQGCTPDEIKTTNHLIHFHLPPLKQAHRTEQSRQHYSEKGILYLATPVIIGSQSASPDTGTMVFALSGSLLVTLHEAESRALKNFAALLHQQPHHLEDAPTAFVTLLRGFVARLADIAEIIAYDMEQVSRIVFQDSLQRSKAPGRGKPDSWRKVLQGLGKTARLNHRLIATLSGLDRLITFACQAEQQERLGTHQIDLLVLQREFKAINDQANAMVNEATFLLDAIVGAISIEQNNVIKIFSMVSVILMPPTMVASVYGMNFTHMPELNHIWGYPVALVVMVISGFLPWYWFRKSGWF